MDTNNYLQNKRYIDVDMNTLVFTPLYTCTKYFFIYFLFILKHMYMDKNMSINLS